MTQSNCTILFIQGSADLYGADVALLQLISGLDQRRFHSIVVVPYNGPLVPHLERAGAHVIVCPQVPVLRRQYMTVRGLLQLIVYSFRSLPWLTSLIRNQSIDLVHSNTLAVLFTGLAAKLARRPQVWHIHEILTRPQHIASLLATLSSAMSTLVVANSNTTADHYRRIRFATSTPISVILNGVDESRVRRSSEATLRSLVSVDSRDVVFTLIGRINRLKGHAVFLDAAERLATEFDNARFLIVGDSFSGQEHLSASVDQRIELSERLRRRAVRLPHIADVGRVYAASDVIVVPSTEPESFGLVAVEAMVAGLPVIASRIGALPEIVVNDRTGILVDPGDPASLLSGMKKLMLSPTQRAEMGREGKKHFERCFRVETYVKKFVQLYAELSKNS